MRGELIILPARIGVRVTRLALRTGVRAAGHVVVIATDVVKSVAGAEHQRQEQPQRERPAPPSPPPSPPTPPPAPSPTGVATERETTPAPSHVSEEPVLVETFAEPGAEEGAGAQVTVDEPWEGYRQMTADDVIDRMRAATSAQLAAVQLYENAHRRRETVLAAARRELRAADKTK